MAFCARTLLPAASSGGELVFVATDQVQGPYSWFVVYLVLLIGSRKVAAGKEPVAQPYTAHLHEILSLAC